MPQLGNREPWHYFPFHYFLKNGGFKWFYGSSSLGFVLGDHHLRKAGVKHKLEFISEIDPKLRKLSETIHEPRVSYSDSWTNIVILSPHKNFPPMPTIAAKDALQRRAADVPFVDLYGAGPPCQPVSSAGRKRGFVFWV